jgi:hypothetical protein
LGSAHAANVNTGKHRNADSTQLVVSRTRGKGVCWGVRSRGRRKDEGKPGSSGPVSVGCVKHLEPSASEDALYHGTREAWRAGRWNRRREMEERTFWRKHENENVTSRGSVACENADKGLTKGMHVITSQPPPPLPHFSLKRRGPTQNKTPRRRGRDALDGLRLWLHPCKGSTGSDEKRERF